MILTIPRSSLKNYKSRDLIPLQCEQCSQPFSLPKNEIQAALTDTKRRRARFCSKKCRSASTNHRTLVECFLCGKSFLAQMSQRGGKHIFCSRSCSCRYRNNNKTAGFLRSKLELWLESQLSELYPNLTIVYNDRKTIKAELDILLPSLNLAFELNGPFHYENIFGRLKETQDNDKRKFAACHEAGISLCVIDTSSQRYFKISSSEKFLEMIKTIIDQEVLRLAEVQRIAL